MKYTAFEADEYDKKIRQIIPYYEDFYKQILDILTVFGKYAGHFKEQISKSRKSSESKEIFCLLKI